MAAIVSMVLSSNEEYYACIFENNCFKVARFDNNKSVIDSKNIKFG
jgi:hypothetical protein